MSDIEFKDFIIEKRKEHSGNNYSDDKFMQGMKQGFENVLDDLEAYSGGKLLISLDDLKELLAEAVSNEWSDSAIQAKIEDYYGNEIPEGFKKHNGSIIPPVPDFVQVQDSSNFFAGCYGTRFAKDIDWTLVDYYKVTLVPTLDVQNLHSPSKYYAFNRYGSVTYYIFDGSVYHYSLIKNNGAYETKELAELALQWPECLSDFYNEFLGGKY